MGSMRWLWLLAVATLVACGAEKGTVSVSLKTAAVAADAASGGADLGNGIVLTEARMVVRRIDLLSSPPPPEATPTPEDADDPDDDLDADDLDGFQGTHFGPFAVDVKGDDLDGGIHPAFDALVDAGAYAGARISVNTPSSRFPADPVLAAMQALHASIVADGTIDGEPFRFKTPMQVSQWKAGPIEVGAGTRNLTLDVDPRGWFERWDGAGRLDPRESSDRGQILANIRCSIRLYLDDDHDGIPDDDGEGDHDAPPCPPPPAPLPGAP